MSKYFRHKPTVRKPHYKTPEPWLVAGACVDYHSIIGGPVTKPSMVVRTDPQQLSHGQWVVWLEKHAGCVAIEAVTQTTRTEGC